MRVIIDFVCGVRTCAGIVSGGYSGCLVGGSGSSLVEKCQLWELERGV